MRRLLSIVMAVRTVLVLVIVLMIVLVTVLVIVIVHLGLRLALFPPAPGAMAPEAVHFPQRLAPFRSRPVVVDVGQRQLFARVYRAPRHERQAVRAPLLDGASGQIRRRVGQYEVSRQVAYLRIQLRPFKVAGDRVEEDSPGCLARNRGSYVREWHTTPLNLPGSDRPIRATGKTTRS